MLNRPDQLPRSVSPWSRREKIARLLWMLIGRPLFRCSFHTWYGYRAALLRLFGASIGKRSFIRPTARIEIPWNLVVGDDAAIGDHAIIYSLATISIGPRATISQYAHLCAGTHDYRDPDLKLIRMPITIHEECWIATDAFVGPGVTVGAFTVVGARASVFKDLPPGKVAVGNPARVIKDRTQNEITTGPEPG